MNIVALTGNLVKDIELKYSPSGVAHTSFTLAVRQRFQTNGEYKSDFIRCKAFKKDAEYIANYGYKGGKVGIEGSIRTGSYESGGNTVYTTEVHVNNVELLSKKQEQSESNYAATNNSPFEVTNSDLPF